MLRYTSNGEAPSTLDEAPVLLQLTGLFALGFTLLQPALPSVSLGSGQIAALWLCSFGAIVSARLVARAVARRVSAVERCLVVGELHEVDRIADKLAASRARASIVACLPVQDVETGGLASPESLRQVVRDLHVHRLIVASTRTDTHAVVELLRMAKLAGVRTPSPIDTSGPKTTNGPTTQSRPSLVSGRCQTR